MNIWLCNRLSVLVDGITEVSGIHNVQQDATEEGQHNPANKEADCSKNGCFLQYQGGFSITST